MTGEPIPGQVWRPSLPGSTAKLVTRLSRTGGVYASLHPRLPYTLSSYYTRPAWEHWVQRFRAMPDARAVQLSEAPNALCR